MQLIKRMIVVFSLMMACVAHASPEVELSVGESIQIGRTRVSCGMGDNSLQSAVSLTCGYVDYNGKCKYYNEETVSGRYCDRAQVCGKIDHNGQCSYYNLTAKCGDRPCRISKRCGKEDHNGMCNFFNESVSCD